MKLSPHDSPAIKLRSAAGFMREAGANDDADMCEEAAAAIERLLAERDEARRVKRWNVDEMGGTLHVCRGEHDGDNCEWESFVPADHLQAAEAQRDRLQAELDALKGGGNGG